MGVRTAAVVLFCLMTVLAARAQRRAEDCGQPSDVVFVLDTSSSIWAKDFKLHVRTFVRDVIQGLQVGPGSRQTRVAVVTFSTRFNLEFPLNRYLNKTRLLMEVMKIDTKGGNTNTHLALKFVDDYVFKTRSGSRPNVPHVVIVLTDGVSREAEDTREAARNLRNNGATIFAIGVGQKQNVSQLNDMASRPVAAHVFEVTDFRALADIKDLLVDKTCQVSTTTQMTITTTTQPPIARCISQPFDIFFVLDSSSSIWKMDFENKVLGFVGDVINLFDVGRDRTRFGVITFSNEAHLAFGLNSFVNKDKLLKAVNPRTVEYRSGITNTADALEMAGEQLNIEGRPRVEQVVILMTDGQSRDPGSTVAEAQKLRRQGVRVVALGVGESVDEQELQGVTGDNEVVKVGDFTSLLNHTRQLASRACGVRDITTTTTTERPQGDSSSDQCNLGRADVVFAYDWSALGTRAVSYLSATLRELFTVLGARGVDVRISMMSSRVCSGERGVPLSYIDEFSKYTRRSPRSRVASALKTVRLSDFTSANGHRTGAKRVVVMVLDDTSPAVLRQVAKEAAVLRRVGVELFAITSGSSDQERQLIRGFAAPSWYSRVIDVASLDFTDVGFMSEEIARYLCGDVREF
ncbi:matrilin-1-like isoform X2 [Babylonia areolata]|uniref:matrilin-1-like isoform X1 n=1 Tax=Babylonia areolata TaxID=304850 RepID=UPI003FCEE677